MEKPAVNQPGRRLITGLLICIGEGMEKEGKGAAEGKGALSQKSHGCSVRSHGYSWILPMQS